MAEEDTTPQFEALLGYMKQSRGFDFAGYKRPSLQRRIDKRIREAQTDGYDAYVDYLEMHPQEFETLFNSILINVTDFFRDAETWTYLQEEILPDHLARLPVDRPLRVWSPGCASGEEAYTLAIVLAELLGEDEFKRRVKIYGTDVDEEALKLARSATYDEAATRGLPEDLRERYFEAAEGRYSFRPDLRRSVIFGRLDVLDDAPISRIELLSCRNTIMYFNAETQAQVIERFHFALNDHAILLLGKAETLLSYSELFTPIDRKRRLFAKVPVPRVRATPLDALAIPTDAAALRPALELHSAALEAVAAPTLLIDYAGILVDVNEAGRNTFGLASRDVGQLLHDLEISYHPMDLRTPIAQSYDDRRPVRVPGVRTAAAGGTAKSFDVEVVPLYAGTEPIGASVFFHDVTVQRDLEDQLRQSTQELEQAYQELQSANEELETTNEELQSTIEELETTNEELQSTNEELETMNEELQSTNDELHTVNEELHVRSDELNVVNHTLEAILATFRGGVVVVDTRRRIRLWNSEAQELWGVREHEVRGADLASIDIGLPVARLIPALTELFANGERQREVTLDAVTRRGRAVECRVTLTPLRANGTVTGAIVVMELLDAREDAGPR